MKKIKDPKFIASFVRRYGNRKFSRQDLASCHVEIHGNSGHGLRINVCRGPQSLAELGWYCNDAWPCQSTGMFFDGLERCDPEALSRDLRAFLRAHDLVGLDGRSMLEVDKEIEIVLLAIGALGEAIVAKDWTFARKMWDFLSPLSEIQRDPAFANVAEVLRTNEALDRPAAKGIH